MKKTLRVIKKAAGLVIASFAFVLLMGEGGRYEVSWLTSITWMLLLFIGAWMMELQNIRVIREKLAEFDQKRGEE